MISSNPFRSLVVGANFSSGTVESRREHLPVSGFYWTVPKCQQWCCRRDNDERKPTGVEVCGSEERSKSKTCSNQSIDGCQRCAGEDGTVVTADFQEKTSRGNGDPSVFLMQISDTITGEYQLTNGLGGKAAEVLTRHGNSFIVERLRVHIPA
ncbi:unnamed protein product [Musa hybrid cultivar]